MAWRKRFKDKPVIMGILNVTPDSFFDGGSYYPRERAIDHALEMAEGGADIIDVGGESTRPGSEPTSLGEELDRVLPVIEGIRKHSSIPLSIDTYKAAVARAAVASGADMVNDISSLSFDEGMAGVVAASGVPVVIQHIKGTPRDMQKNPSYQDVTGEIKEFFIERIAYARSCGIDEDDIIIDPGIGFGKRVSDNLTIIRGARPPEGAGQAAPHRHVHEELHRAHHGNGCAGREGRRHPRERCHLALERSRHGEGPRCCEDEKGGHVHEGFDGGTAMSLVAHSSAGA